VAVAPDRGTAMLLTVRDTFKSPIMEIFYSLFLLAALFHAFNGFWTFFLTWGLILSINARKVF
jgi:succinate dehydrogenase / fumarate reductase cytochrome b subunit